MISAYLSSGRCTKLVYERRQRGRRLSVPLFEGTVLVETLELYRLSPCPRSIVGHEACSYQWRTTAE